MTVAPPFGPPRVSRLQVSVSFSRSRPRVAASPAPTSPGASATPRPGKRRPFLTLAKVF